MRARSTNQPECHYKEEDDMICPEDENLEALTRASVVEMLNEMMKTIARLRGCTYLSHAQHEHLTVARRRISQVVAEWIDAVMGDRTSSARRTRNAESSTPEQPTRGLECVLDMLTIYHDDLNERDFTPVQMQRLMIAAHNLLMVAQTLKTNVH